MYPKLTLPASSIMDASARKAMTGPAMSESKSGGNAVLVVLEDEDEEEDEEEEADPIPRPL